MKGAVLLILFLLGTIQLEGFGQGSQQPNPLRFKVDNDVLYEHYANNKLELNRIGTLIEKHAEDIFLNKGYFQLIAYFPKEKSDDPTTLNRAALCAAVVRGWMRAQNPSLAKMACAFSFSAYDSSYIEVAVRYIAAPLDANTPQAIHFTNDKENSKAIRSALSRYETLPFVASDNGGLTVAKESDNTHRQTPAIANTDTNQTSPSGSTVSTTTIIPDFIIYFRVDKSYIDPNYMNNAAVLNWIGRLVDQRNIDYIDSLVISAYASPEAPLDYNKRLSQRRANAVRDYLLKQFTSLKPEIVHAYGHGENWHGLRQLAEEDTQLPMRNEVLRIIDSNLPEDERERKLKALQGGAVYRYIYKNYYPRLRLGASLSVMIAEIAPPDLRTTIFGPDVQRPAIEPPVLLPVVPLKIDKYSYPFALRTNMLYDAIGGLNIGVELPFGKKKNWSLIADMAYSFWRGPKNRIAFQTLEYGLESRYWFGVNQERKNRKPIWAKPLKGFYVGAYGSYWQRYDVQMIDGYQGDGSWSAGLVAGYTIPLNRSLSFDLGIGAGWFSTSEYRHYHQPEYNHLGKYHLMWQETGKWGGLSLTKLRFTLVWTIQTKTQKRGGDR